MRLLEVMAEYGCHPVWVEHADGGVENVNPSTLGLPEGLSAELRGWARERDEVFNSVQYPPDAAFATESAGQEFLRRGEDRARQLAHFLCPTCPVTYSGLGDRKIRVYP